MPSILIVDDLVAIHEMLEAVVQPTGLTAGFATNGEQALAKYKSEKFDLVLTDVDMKPMDGMTLLKELRAFDPASVVIIMTGFASTDSAIQALKLGAFDYIQKPFKVDELLKTIRRALEFKEFSQSEFSTAAPSAQPENEWEARLIGRSPATARLVQQLKKLAGSKSPVLLQGEAGTGKRMVAELLHRTSNPGGAPFVRVDCTHAEEADFAEKLIGSQGSTGAWFGEAKGGTLFLDNIPSLPAMLQRALVGVLRAAGQGVRIVCSSAIDLEAAVDEGKFDDQLFYRLASLPVLLPPLRERREDIPALINDIVQQSANPTFASNTIEFTEDAMQTLCAHYWPGNLLELNQVVAKLVSTTDVRMISSRQLPMRLRELSDWPSLEDYLAGQEKEYISTVLSACKDDKTLAARILKCDPAKLG
ncbi:MAG: sigma-54-dependent transcriptional regulator [Opitutaceae bacterium]